MGEVAQSSSGTSLQESSTSKSEKRKVRRRKKKLFKSIRDQMEFYFSDANLRKDRYMNELVMKDDEGYVDLEVFLTFHKIRSLTSDVKDIAGAIAASELLQMDEEHMRVRRCADLTAKTDVDECTLYVERLPLHADHAWLKGVFSRYGRVVYVSLPRYRHNNRIKGFAFIEFAAPEDVDRACQHFGYQDGSSRHSNVAAGPTAVADEVLEDKGEKSEDEDAPPAKRRREGSSETTGHVAFSVDIKADEDKEDVATTTDAESSDTGTAKGELEVPGGTGMECSMLMQAKRKKKLRKRKKKTQHSESKEQQPSLLVMPKCEWKRLRNKYLALQKATMAQIKRSLLLPSSGCTPAPSPSYTLSSPVQASTDSDMILTSQEDEAWEMSSDSKGNTELPNNMDTAQAPPTLQFQPGVIVKLVTEKPVSNTAEFKNKIRQLANVAYVDVMEGDSVAYVRCADPDGAYQFIENQKESFCGALSLLAGDEEKSYWEKINLDRETRRNQKTRQKKRGVEKVMAKAQKMMEKKNLHIRFDDL
ncbi:la-related protein 7 [Dermacentor albipictus]|uniref:la-related protein 7 n=1 Tax=Dermacentor albipictus TaxID=60249 RepID=UPI0031FCAA99